MARIRLTPAELEAQSAEMNALKEEYAALFADGVKTLEGVNANWSANLARNFTGKILSVQKSCRNIVSMLDTGAAVAASSAKSFVSVDSLLAKQAVSEGEADRAAGAVADMINKMYSPLKSAGKQKPTEEELEQIQAKLKEDLHNATSRGVRAVKKGAAVVWDGAKNVAGWVADLYNEKGVFYRIIKGGTAAVKTLVSCTVIAAIWGADGLSGGALTPLAVITTGYMMNSIVSNGSDLMYCIMNQTDQVGKTNLLSDFLEGLCGDIGGFLGQKELGKLLGKGIYTLGKVVSVVGSVEGLSDLLSIEGWWPAILKGAEIGKDIGKEIGTFIDDFINTYTPGLLNLDIDVINVNDWKTLYDVLKGLKKITELDDKWFGFWESLGLI